MRIGVLGNSRNRLGVEYDNYEYVDTVLTALQHTYKFSDIVSGGGKGTEAAVAKWCTSNSLRYTKIAPVLNKEVSMEDAFLNRNQRVIEQVDMLVWFWNGTSADFIAHGLVKATARNIRTIIIPLE